MSLVVVFRSLPAIVRRYVDVFRRPPGLLPQELDDGESSRPAIALVFAAGVDGNHLTNVFLVHPSEPRGCSESIVALDHDGDLVLEMNDSRSRHRKAKLRGQGQAKVLVLRR